MKVTWKLIVLGTTGIVGIVTIAIVALYNGMDGVLVKAAFVGIGVIVAGIGGYTFGIKRRLKTD